MSGGSVAKGKKLRVASRRFLASTVASVAVVALLATTLPASSAVTAATGGRPESAADRYIVVLDDQVDSLRVSAALARVHGISVGHVYAHSFKGFSAVVPPGRVAALSSDPSVVSVQADDVVSIDHCIAGNRVHDAHCSTTTTSSTTTTTTTTTLSTTTTSAPSSGESIPTGVLRIGGSGTLGSGNVAVAVIDTGIDVDHPDLNVVGGVNCASGPSSKYNDGHGHGSHVAGTIGAAENGFGVIGVAPGVSLYAVRVLNNAGMGFRSDIICGIDWVTANAATKNIRVANMSLGGSGSDDGRTCSTTTDAYKKALCGAVNTGGVTFAVAAGNDSDNAANHLPAAYDMVITVSALADFNGAPGGGGASTCRSDVDDTFADFSNYGSDVDIIAPGVCILSTWKDGGYNTISGTSMATPHVAGAAALYLSTNATATPTNVQTALIAAGTFDWDNTDDGDNTKEPLLKVK